MAVIENKSSLKFDDISFMAAHLYQAKVAESKTVDFDIQGFIFQCQPETGEVVQLPSRVGHVISKLGAKEEEPYRFQISCALQLAAKVHLLAEIKKIPGLNAMIPADIFSARQIDASAVNQLLEKFILPKSRGMFKIFGVFGGETASSPAMRAVSASLSKSVLLSIHSFSDVDALCQTIHTQLHPSSVSLK